MSPTSVLSWLVLMLWTASNRSLESIRVTHGMSPALTPYICFNDSLMKWRFPITLVTAIVLAPRELLTTLSIFLLPQVRATAWWVTLLTRKITWPAKLKAWSIFFVASKPLKSLKDNNFIVIIHPTNENKMALETRHRKAYFKIEIWENSSPQYYYNSFSILKMKPQW